MEKLQIWREGEDQVFYFGHFPNHRVGMQIGSGACESGLEINIWKTFVYTWDTEPWTWMKSPGWWWWWGECTKKREKIREVRF